MSTALDEELREDAAVEDGDAGLADSALTTIWRAIDGWLPRRRQVRPGQPVPRTIRR